MFNPALQSLLAQAHVEELHRAARTYNLGRYVNRPPAAPLSTLIKRAINRGFAGGPAVNGQVAPVRGFEAVGHRPTAP